MFHPQQEIFFRLPGEGSRRVLHPARILASTPRSCTAQLLEPATIAPDADLHVLYKVASRFVQCPIRIEAIVEGPEGPVVSFFPSGDAVSANSRECFRVSTAVSRLTATLGDEPACPVMDLSAAGLSIVSNRAHAIGDRLDVAISYQGHTYTGAACVQSAKDLGRGRTRYGLLCLKGRAGEGNLSAGLGIICSAIQLMQLRRLAGKSA